MLSEKPKMKEFFLLFHIFQVLQYFTFWEPKEELYDHSWYFQEQRTSRILFVLSSFLHIRDSADHKMVENFTIGP